MSKKVSYIIDKKMLYTPREIETLQLVPSKIKVKSFLNRRKVTEMINEGVLKTTLSKKVSNGKTFNWVSGEELIKYIKENLSKDRWPKSLK